MKPIRLSCRLPAVAQGLLVLDADQLYDRIGLALTSSANFFINYVVFQVCCCPLIQMSTCETRICVAIILVWWHGDGLHTH